MNLEPLGLCKVQDERETLTETLSEGIAQHSIGKSQKAHGNSGQERKDVRPGWGHIPGHFLNFNYGLGINSY